MKLKNKKTGEIGYLIVGKGSDHYVVANDEWGSCGEYSSLAELNAEWEDMPEEPKWLRDYWFIDSCGSIIKQEDDVLGSARREIGNYFLSREDAEKAVEKLKAFKRLKDKGFKFVGWCGSVSDNNPDMALFKLDKHAWETDTCDDLDILFGGEE